MLTLTDLHHAYAGSPVLQGVNLCLNAGEIGCLLGPSGCGKTTLLRLIAGFETPQRGQITLGTHSLVGPAGSLPPERRQVGLVFQDYALFAHLRVADNVAFGLGHLPRAARAQRVAELLAQVDLSAQAQAWPHQLSGGQQQRVALARALAPKPRLLLLDEPFSNLDVNLRERLAHEVRSLLEREGLSALLVTHDQDEAFAFADRVAVLHQGRVVQMDTPYDLYHRPTQRFVADFIGEGVRLPGRVCADGGVACELGVLHGAQPAECDGGSCLVYGAGAEVDVLLRPDDIVHDDASPLRAQIVRRAFRGATFLYTLRLASGAQVLALVPSHHQHAVGQQLGLRLNVDHVVAFKSAPGA